VEKRGSWRVTDDAIDYEMTDDGADTVTPQPTSEPGYFRWAGHVQHRREGK
jgi:hypothetical protein